MKIGIVLCGLLLACGGSSSPAPKAKTPPTGDGVTATTGTPSAKKSLFDRLGGMPAITAVTSELVDRTTTDPRIAFRFSNTDAPKLKTLLAELVCMATGGPCKYSGRDMAMSHAGMELVDEEFDALVEDLIAALDKFNVPAPEKADLLAILGPLEPDIVVDATKLTPIADADLAPVTKQASALANKDAAALVTAAVMAGKRGQRNYAEQLFTRAEMLAGAKEVSAGAAVFRKGAPPRITTALKHLPETTAPQPASAGTSDEDSPDKKPQRGSLSGMLKSDGKAISGFGVVMMWPKKGALKKRTPKTRIIEQRNKVFAPSVTAVPAGSTIEFPNFDTIYHNVFSLSKSKAFDLGMYKSGDLREVKFDKPGIVRLGCNIHANMAAYVVVVDAPHYAVAAADGSFSFKSLAPGKYKVQSWSERSVEPTTSELEIKAGANTAEIDVKAGATMAPPPDKFGVARSK